MFKVYSAITAVFLAVFLLFTAVFTVGETEEALVFHNGKYAYTETSGLHFKLPLLTSVKYVDLTVFGNQYNLQAYSHDQQPTKLKVSVLYRVPKGMGFEVYKRYQTIENMHAATLERYTPNILENQFGKYTAVSAVQNRANLTKEFSDSLKEAMKNVPLVIESVNIENIDFSSAYEKSVEERMQAEVAVATQQQQAQKEKISAEIVETRATAQANAQYAVAQAEAKAIETKGRAEAQSMEAKAKVLRENPGLVEYQKVVQWNGILPTTMVPGSSVPFVNIK